MTGCSQSCTETNKKEININDGLVYVFDNDTLGKGDEKLGTTLMKGFIYALTEQDVLPKSIIFYNKGIVLTTTNRDCIEDLKTLEKLGVEILSCGTCLNYYGLKDELKVGTVTNMYTIVEKLNNASSVINV